MQNKKQIDNKQVHTYIRMDELYNGDSSQHAISTPEEKDNSQSVKYALTVD